MILSRKITLTISLFIAGVCAHAQTDTQRTEIYNLIKRIIPAHANAFEIAFIPKNGDKDVFELESKNNKIILRGNNGVTIASALNYYLKNYTHCDISWNGSNLNLPAKLPAVKGKVRISTPYKYRYYLNYCTFNYTMSWWDWDRWQWEIDWMALNGINMPLALTGQNIIWDRVYKSLGFTDADLKTFYSGPAYFNWFWMGNLDGWGGPLPQSWMINHEALQKKILARERALGMTPILPAFTGHVPPSFEKKFPKASIKKTLWSGFPDSVSILDPNDPMFTTIGKKFIEEEVKTFGTNHLYSADTFNENTPPTSDSTFLNDVSKKVYQSMAGADPKAIWIMQGWMFSFSAKFWQPTQIKALLNAVPNDKMIILDLYSESKPVWNRTDAYYGKPWIWCMLHNFGGNISMYGRMNNVANDPANALNSPQSGHMQGIGLTPEAIEQNPVMYALMLENVWRDKPIDLDSWLKDYAYRRYGKQNSTINEAWNILRQTVYNGAVTSGGPESIITGRPTFKRSNRWASTKKAYHPKDIIPAWEKLISVADELKNSQGYQYDLVDLTRQVMANYADTLQHAFAYDYKVKDMDAFNQHAKQFLAVISDMDKLLATRKDFLLGVWLNTARQNGTTAAEKALYEKNARNQITLWGDKNSVLHDYACKQWSGLLNNFYKPRWEHFFTYVNNSVQQGKPADEKVFDKQIRDWEWQWVEGSEQYPDKPSGDAITIAKEMYAKYHPLITKLNLKE
ncbi:alpha-N-acetylglucosaminidase [Pedobacter sp. BS3]|uniref:alpha-N-acetylglucosaminidase n=1 Tax=Pedobacter sp. BS3 TaxID=2567937 RepID=UPI0011EDC7F2|nr:alpha-N-acetylglucosaminidase [Pedobacter sp. BS3]TZF82219.1 alpha-N-acetylglucosaminidase [Pedobacter sp. BS3]